MGLHGVANTNQFSTEMERVHIWGAVLHTSLIVRLRLRPRIVYFSPCIRLGFPTYNSGFMVLQCLDRARFDDRSTFPFDRQKDVCGGFCSMWFVFLLWTDHSSMFASPYVDNGARLDDFLCENLIVQLPVSLGSKQ